MIIYLSGGLIAPDVDIPLIEYGCARLQSFAYPKPLWYFLDLVKSVNYHRKIDVLLDSGAFTAWSKGKEAKIEDLITGFSDALNKYEDCCNLHLINLDIIPGRKGVDPTPEEIKDAMILSMKNFLELNKLFPGKVLPVYHQGEPPQYLREMFDCSDYICLSPRNDVPEKQRVQWAQESHNATTKFHGLATTGMQMMNTVNWFSVDSAVWLMAAATGSIFIPTNNRLKRLSVSDISGNTKVSDSHLDNCYSRDWILSFIESKGVDAAELRTDHKQRWIWNAKRLIDFQNEGPQKEKHYIKGLFS